MSSLTNLLTWFNDHGRVHEVKSDPRGKWWVSGYLEDIHGLLEDEIKRAEKRGARKKK